MNFEELTRKLSQTQKPAQKKPCQGCKKKQPTLEDRIVELGKAQAAMVAIWTIDAAGNLSYTCHRENFPTAELQPAAEQFSKDQYEDYLKNLMREVIAEA